MTECDCVDHGKAFTLSSFVNTFDLPIHVNTLRKYLDDKKMKLHGYKLKKYRYILACTHNKELLHIPMRHK